MGIVWNTKDDTLGVAIEEEKYTARARTPREIVQQQASLYDPLGIIAPFIMLGRQWIQKSMSGKWSWDTPSTKEVEEGFNTWTEMIPKLREVRIERAWDVEETVGGEEELHFFSDASAKGLVQWAIIV